MNDNYLNFDFESVEVKDTMKFRLYPTHGRKINFDGPLTLLVNTSCDPPVLFYFDKVIYMLVTNSNYSCQDGDQVERYLRDVLGYGRETATQKHNMVDVSFVWNSVVVCDMEKHRFIADSLIADSGPRDSITFANAAGWTGMLKKKFPSYADQWKEKTVQTLNVERECKIVTTTVNKTDNYYDQFMSLCFACQMFAKEAVKFNGDGFVYAPFFGQGIFQYHTDFITTCIFYNFGYAVNFVVPDEELFDQDLVIILANTTAASRAAENYSQMVKKGNKQAPCLYPTCFLDFSKSQLNQTEEVVKICEDQFDKVSKYEKKHNKSSFRFTRGTTKTLRKIVKKYNEQSSDDSTSSSQDSEESKGEGASAVKKSKSPVSSTQSSEDDSTSRENDKKKKRKQKNKKKQKEKEIKSVDDEVETAEKYAKANIEFERPVVADIEVKENEAVVVSKEDIVEVLKGYASRKPLDEIGDACDYTGDELKIYRDRMQRIFIDVLKKKTLTDRNAKFLQEHAGFLPVFDYEGEFITDSTLYYPNPVPYNHSLAIVSQIIHRNLCEVCSTLPEDNGNKNPKIAVRRKGDEIVMFVFENGTTKYKPEKGVYHCHGFEFPSDTGCYVVDQSFLKEKFFHLKEWIKAYSWQILWLDTPIMLELKRHCEKVLHAVCYISNSIAFFFAKPDTSKLTTEEEKNFKYANLIFGAPSGHWWFHYVDDYCDMYYDFCTATSEVKRIKDDATQKKLLKLPSKLTLALVFMYNFKCVYGWLSQATHQWLDSVTTWLQVICLVLLVLMLRKIMKTIVDVLAPLVASIQSAILYMYFKYYAKKHGQKVKVKKWPKPGLWMKIKEDGKTIYYHESYTGHMNEVPNTIFALIFICLLTPASAFYFDVNSRFNVSTATGLLHIQSELLDFNYSRKTSAVTFNYYRYEKYTQRHCLGTTECHIGCPQIAAYHSNCEIVDAKWPDCFLGKECIHTYYDRYEEKQQLYWFTDPKLYLAVDVNNKHFDFEVELFKTNLYHNGSMQISVPDVSDFPENVLVNDDGIIHTTNPKILHRIDNGEYTCDPECHSIEFDFPNILPPSKIEFNILDYSIFDYKTTSCIIELCNVFEVDGYRSVNCRMSKPTCSLKIYANDKLIKTTLVNTNQNYSIPIVDMYQMQVCADNCKFFGEFVQKGKIKMAKTVDNFYETKGVQYYINFCVCILSIISLFMLTVDLFCYNKIILCLSIVVWIIAVVLGCLFLELNVIGIVSIAILSISLFLFCVDIFLLLGVFSRCCFRKSHTKPKRY